MISAFAVAAFLFAAPAEPEPAAPSQQFPDFATCDANHDGRVTKAEFIAALSADQKKIGERVFAARDVNKDGVLTREEFNPPAPK
ncbi:MAG: EF-hand domain-containing protein [Alphaproteobacteria bacterium]